MRYAVYAIPGIAEHDDPAALAVRAAAESWLARDDVQDVTVDARRYGFHATIKAPFRLRDGVDEDALVAGVRAVAAARGPVPIPSLVLATIGGFRALVPGADDAEIAELAADVVRDLDPLRAPLTPDEVARRRPERLTPRQRTLLATWGYPYVLDELRLHMTLTDRLDGDRARTVDAQLAEHLGDVVGSTALLTTLALCVEPATGAAFAIHSIHPLAVGESSAGSPA